MKKLFIIITIALCGCAGNEEKQMRNKSDSLSIAQDSAYAKDTLLLKLKQETTTSIKTK